jgi:hypothetical protein
MRVSEILSVVAGILDNREIAGTAENGGFARFLEAKYRAVYPKLYPKNDEPRRARPFLLGGRQVTKRPSVRLSPLATHLPKDQLSDPP